MSVIKSVANDDKTVIESIMSLHMDSDQFDLDPTYSIGNFYKNTGIKRPTIVGDIAPALDYVRLMDVKSLQLPDSSVKSIIFDPPFMFGHHGQTKNNAMNKRFSMFESYEAMRECYQLALKEFQRVLVPKGIVAFKCQDYTDSRSTMTHCLVHNWALDAGLYPKDLFILAWTQGRIYNPNLRQKHARKFHSYWWVFSKENPPKWVL